MIKGILRPRCTDREMETELQRGMERTKGPICVNRVSEPRERAFVAFIQSSDDSLMWKKKCTYFPSSSLFLRAAAVGTGEGEHLPYLLGGGNLALTKPHFQLISLFFMR